MKNYYLIKIERLETLSRDLIKNSKIINLKSFGDEQGQLTVLSENDGFPFRVRRIFYIYDVNENAIRGEHANLETKFLLIAVSGSVTLNLSDGVNEKEIVLSKPDEALFVENCVWKEMSKFSFGAVLLCLCSEEFNPDEYVSDLDAVKELNHADN